MIKVKKPLVIGICGGSGSGKTTLLRRLAEELNAENPAVFSMDNYYHPIERQAVDQNGVINFDLPILASKTIAITQPSSSDKLPLLGTKTGSPPKTLSPKL